MFDSGFWAFIIAGFTALIVWDALWQRNRKAVLRAMVLRRGFVYLGNAIPRSLTLHGTPFERATSIWNVIEGDCRGIRFIAFDCRVGGGKGSWRRTAIAALSDRDVFGVMKFNLDLTVDRSGDWVILYEPKRLSLITHGLMPASELEAILDSIEP